MLLLVILPLPFPGAWLYTWDDWPRGLTLPHCVALQHSECPFWKASDLWRRITRNTMSTFAILQGEGSRMYGLTTTGQTGRQVKQQAWAWHKGTSATEQGSGSDCVFSKPQQKEQENISVYTEPKNEMPGAISLPKQPNKPPSYFIPCCKTLRLPWKVLFSNICKKSKG